MVAEDVSSGGAAGAALPERMHVLLIEDDDGDALLVEELLLDAGVPFILSRARSLAEARGLLTDTVCALLDLDLPDSRGLQGVRWLRETSPDVAVVVLTGLADEHLGEEAVAAGAQDYLVKGQVDGFLLQRVVRYAVERQRAEETQRQLYEARLYAAENSRLERGLLPSPVLTDRRLVGGGPLPVGRAADAARGRLLRCRRGRRRLGVRHGRRRLRTRAGRSRAGRLPPGGLADHDPGRAAGGRDPVGRSAAPGA